MKILNIHLLTNKNLKKRLDAAKLEQWQIDSAIIKRQLYQITYLCTQLR